MGIFKDLIKALIRAGLYSLFSWMIRKGWITQEQADSWLDPMTLKILGVIGFVAVYLWSARDKYKSWLFGIIARQMKPGALGADVKREIKKLPTGVKVNKVFKDAA